MDGLIRRLLPIHSPTEPHWPTLSPVSLATGRGPSRLNGGELEMAATIGDFAQDEFESNALEIMRQLPPKKRRVACSILELLLT